MSIFEYDEERHKKFIREEGYEDGFSAGHSLGLSEGISQGISEGISQGISQGIEAMVLENLEENVPTERILEKLQKHFHLTAEEAKVFFEKYASRLYSVIKE